MPSEWRAFIIRTNNNTNRCPDSAPRPSPSALSGLDNLSPVPGDYRSLHPSQDGGRPPPALNADGNKGSTPHGNAWEDCRWPCNSLEYPWQNGPGPCQSARHRADNRPAPSEGRNPSAAIVSDSVPQEVGIVDDMIFLDLKDTPIVTWVDKILQFKKHKRKNRAEKVKRAGYDIKSTAETVRKLYLSKWISWYLKRENRYRLKSVNDYVWKFDDVIRDSTVFVKIARIKNISFNK